jgi:hypothetical protein
MSFLDSLENNLKSLESREDGAQRDKEDRKKREAEWAQTQAAAPFADRLKNGSFTAVLLEEATRIGHSQRTKVHIAWLGTSLRLEAKTRKLELRPTGEGVVGVWFENGQEVRQEAVDLTGDAGRLAKAWLEPVGS